MKNLNRQNTKRGFIGTIIVIIAVLILIAYFRTDIMKFFGSPAVKGTLLTVIGWIQNALLWVVAKLGWTSSQIK